MDLAEGVRALWWKPREVVLHMMVLMMGWRAVYGCACVCQSSGFRGNGCHGGLVMHGALTWPMLCSTTHGCTDAVLHGKQQLHVQWRHGLQPIQPRTSVEIPVVTVTVHVTTAAGGR